MIFRLFRIFDIPKIGPMVVPAMVAAVLLCPVSSATADRLVQKDPSITCDGVPRWDRFVVNTRDTKWNPAGAGCYLLPDGTVVRADDMGERGTYGTYTSEDWRDLYGKYDPDAGEKSDNRKLYGRYGDERFEEPAPAAAAPVRSSAPAVPAAKPKPKSAPAATPKPAAKSQPAPFPAAVPVATAEPKPKPTPKPAPMAKPVATNIASATRAMCPDEFCTEINNPVKGALPDGLVLMAGAPDKMCCVKK